MITEHKCTQSFNLTIKCPDTLGIVAAVSTFLANEKAFITESSHFGDLDTGTFFMRTVFNSASAKPIEHNAIKEKFSKIARQFNMDWQIFNAQERIKTIIAVSKFGHCLNDLLHRVKIGSIPIDICGVVSNHETFRDLVEWHGIRFHHIPINRNNKSDQEAKLLSLFSETSSELLVLARYMQILSQNTCERLSNRIINIHHSFLPGFKGARPYHQAHSRGVKIIGATAHYVTADLDEGPIIEQAVERVDHTFSPKGLVNLGQDMENTVLARAVKWHAEKRVLVNGTKTVVFR
ncbi:MAG: formyltetrahydrofolate deformylase [Rhodospirillaceae bacterium]|nr:formyltetrahydrofolate deformylase [Rhodospirillaceae bacterium]